MNIYFVLKHLHEPSQPNNIHPDPPSKYHLLRCLRSLLPATYDLYDSVVAPCRLASGIILMAREVPFVCNYNILPNQVAVLVFSFGHRSI